MSRSEIADQVRWNDSNLGELSLFVPLFGRELKFLLFPRDRAPAEVTERMAATVNDVLALQPSEIERVKELLWEECNFAFQVTYYGVEAQPGETPLQATLREFGVTGPDEALRQSEIKEIHIVDEHSGRYAEIKVSTCSECYISLIVKNGKLIDFDDDGTFLGCFDGDEQHARRKRQKVLGN